MKTLELFAGSCSFTKVAKKYGCQTFTSDIKTMKGIDYVIDILNIDLRLLPFIPDIIWLSPDCAAWSKAAGKIHFDGKKLIPKTAKAKEAFEIINKCIEILNYFFSLNRDVKFYIENPEGKLRMYLQPETLFSKIPGSKLVVIDQCQYGREFQKTTHIFTNDFRWVPRQRCPGLPACTHERNIKNYGTGMKSSLGKLDNYSYYKRALIPSDLCEEIILNNFKYLNN